MLRKIAYFLGPLSFIALLWSWFQLQQVSHELNEAHMQLETCDAFEVGKQVTNGLVNELISDKELRDIVQFRLTSFVSSLASETTAPLVKQFITTYSRNFLPQNVITMLDNIAVANFSKTANVVQHFFHNLSLGYYQLSNMKNPSDLCTYCYYDYWWGWICYDYYCSSLYTRWGDKLEVSSQVAGIFQNVQYQSNHNIYSDGSQLGNLIAEIQPTIEQTFGSRSITRELAQNCITLAMRVIVPEYRVCYQSEYCRDISYDVKKWAQIIRDQCQALEWSTLY